MLSNNTVIVDVKVSDLTRAVEFYAKTLGLKLLVKEKTWASLKAKNVQLHLNVEWGATDGVEFTVENIVSVIASLKERNVKTSPIEIHAWGKISYFRDSEGNKLAIVQEK